MVRFPAEHANSPSVEQVNFCFLNPAWMPEWFWLPTAHGIIRGGGDYYIPPLERDNLAVDMEMNIDIVESTMQNKPAQYIVALSRGVEYAVRYIDRMAKNGRSQNILGLTIISSAGPKGYESKLESPVRTQPRHTEEYLSGVALDESGLEVINPRVAQACMLQDVGDRRLCDEIINGLVKGRPLTAAEVASVPFLAPDSVPTAWYIGRKDKVDNPDLSACIARTIFHIEPSYTDWGHIGPLTHTEQVVEALLTDTESALAPREI